VHQGTAQALKVSGHVCLITAALGYGWEVKAVPELPQVAVPKDRRLDAEARATIEPIWTDLMVRDVEGLSTNETKTLEMCGRRLPFDEALAITDSALRAGYPSSALREAANAAKGPGSARWRRVAQEADGRAANPFESVLRAIALTVPGLDVEPQVRIVGDLGLNARPDLGDVRRRLVLEADSFEWHGDRAALRRDARRYDLMVSNGWTVLRFAWEDVMHDQDWVRSVLAAAVGRTDRHLSPALQA
jgi:very-short-patch-repair endonuclease